MQKRHARKLFATPLGLAALVVTMVAAPRQADARKLFLNGVEVEGLSNQTFSSCEVRFDQEGNVWITAKGYAVKVGGKTAKPIPGKTAPAGAGSGSTGSTTATTPASGDDATPAPGAKLTKRYWIVSMQPRVGAAQYDVNVFINGKFVRKIRSKDAQTVVDITDHVKVGKNLLQFAATKNYGESGKRFSSSPEDTFRVLVGEGAMGKGSVMISAPLAEMTRNASETENKAAQSSFIGR